MSAMTIGEKMVWAAAFALEYQRVVKTCPTPALYGTLAAKFADSAVSALRFGAPDEGAFYHAMVHE